jgi:glycerate-2-kinase
MTSRYSPIHRRIEQWFREALKVVEPRSAVRRVLGWDSALLTVDGEAVPVADGARVIVIAVGKAAPAMARGAADVLGNRIDRGIVLTKDGHLDGVIPKFDLFEAAHPIPDERGIIATREIVRTVEGLSADDVVLALISGGGSALLELPRDPLTLEHMQQTTKRLMHAGAGIHDLNAVRSVLSQVKGGGLRRAIGDARCVSLLLSDVLGNDPEVIASGPTIWSTPLKLKAREIVSRFNVWDQIPPGVQDLLSADDSVSESRADDRDIWSVIADNETLVTEMQCLVERDGFKGCVRWRGFDGDATELGQLLVRDAQGADPGIDVLLGGGEGTVEVVGDGIGGRNTEAALSAALVLDADADGNWCIASLASDGDDGMANASGAIADPESIARGRERDLDARQFLETNDSASYFRQTGGLVVTGPTGTNVNDVYVAVRVGSMEMQDW